MVICAVGTMILGIILAIRTTKKKAPVVGSIVAGILIPLIFLWVGQKEVEKPNPFHPDSQAEIPGPGISPLPLPLDNIDDLGPPPLPPGKPEQ